MCSHIDLVYVMFCVSSVLCWYQYWHWYDGDTSDELIGRVAANLPCGLIYITKQFFVCQTIARTSIGTSLACWSTPVVLSNIDRNHGWFIDVHVCYIAYGCIGNELFVLFSVINNAVLFTGHFIAVISNRCLPAHAGTADATRTTQHECCRIQKSLKPPTEFWNYLWISLTKRPCVKRYFSLNKCLVVENFSSRNYPSTIPTGQFDIKSMKTWTYRPMLSWTSVWPLVGERVGEMETLLTIRESGVGNVGLYLSVISGHAAGRATGCLGKVPAALL